MKKVLGKAFKITGISLVVLLVIIILIPIVFGKQIKQAVKDYINEEVNATVYFEDVSISIFKNFPHLTVTLDKFGVVGKDEFKGDTLLDVKQFGVVVDLGSLFSDKYKVNKVTLETPRIKAKVNKAGKPNWDIMKPSADSAVVDTAKPDTSKASALALQLDSYKISNGYVEYDDRAGDMYLEVENLNHKGSGDFRKDAYDFETYTSCDSVTFESGGTNYLDHGKIDADLTVNIDSKNNIYTLKDNRIGLNAIELKFDGWVSMKGEDIGMDIKFNTNKNTFKSVLSMVPGMYTKDFDKIDTDGTFALDGNVKGTLNETSIPGFNVHLGVTNGRFKYPDLPDEVKDINFDLKASSPGPTLDNLKIEVPKFHAQLGKAPIDARLLLTGVTNANMFIDAMMKANINLEDLTKMFPMEGTTLKGKFFVDGTAKGTVNTAAGTFPVVNAILKLENGYYKSADFPSAIDKMSMNATMKCPGTNIAEANLDVTQFHAEIDGEPLDATLKAQNFDDVNYSATAKGRLNLEKLNKIYPIEGTTMAGILNIDLTTSGKVSAIEAEKYAELPTSGSLDIKGLKYSSTDVPQGISISDGRVTLTPEKINIERYTGTIGSSPVLITGYLQNYLGYLFLENQKIKGQMNLVSSNFNVNEWIVEDPASAPAPATSGQAAAPAEDVPMEVFEVPTDIDFNFGCSIGTVLYDNLVLKDMKGTVVMREGKVSFNELLFNTLGGNFKMNGSYDTKDVKAPAIAFGLNLANLDIKQAYEAFVIVKQLAPVAKFVNGKFSTTLNLNGKLLGDMSPDLTTITADGIATVADGVLKGFKATEMVADKIKMDKIRELRLKDTKIKFKVANGRLTVEPFDVAIGAGKMVVSGSNGLDQSMAYDLAFDMPPGVAGTAAMNAVGGLIGKPFEANSNFKVNVGLGGTIDNPKITYVRNANGEGIKEIVTEKIEEVTEKVKDTVKAIVTEKIDDAKEKAKAEAARIMAEAEKAAAKIRAEGKTAADKVKAEANKRADDMEKSAKNPIEKVAKKKAADIVRKEGVNSANKLQKEADAKADKVLADARAKSDALLKK